MFRTIRFLNFKTIETEDNFADRVRVLPKTSWIDYPSYLIIHDSTAHLTHKNVKVPSWSNVINAIHTDMKERAVEHDVNPLKVYQTYVSRTTKIWPEFLEKAILVGQLQLLRNLIAFHLNKSCKFNAKNLEASLRTLNRSLLLDLNQDKPMPSENVIKKLSEYLDYAGLNDPLNKVYVIERSDKSYAITMFIFVLAHVKLIFLPQKLGVFFLFM